MGRKYFLLKTVAGFLFHVNTDEEDCLDIYDWACKASKNSKKISEKWQQLWNKILKNAVAVWNRMQRYVIKGKGLKEVAYGAGVFQ